MRHSHHTAWSHHADTAFIEVGPPCPSLRGLICSAGMCLYQGTLCYVRQAGKSIWECLPFDTNMKSVLLTAAHCSSVEWLKTLINIDSLYCANPAFLLPLAFSESST